MNQIEIYPMPNNKRCFKTVTHVKDYGNNGKGF